MRPRWVVVPVALALAAAACTGDDDTTAPESPAGPDTTSPTPTAPAPDDPAASALAELGGNLAVLSDGQVHVVRPDGTGARTLSDTTGAVRQPTWAPSGARVAWAVAHDDGGEVATTRVDEPEVTRVETTTPAFYLQWDPFSRRVAALRGGAEALELSVVDVAAGTVRNLDSGRPYYLSWAPDGERLAVHVGTDRLDVVELDGQRRALGPAPGDFLAPRWTGPGPLVAVTRDEGGQRLVVGDPSFDDLETLVRFDGFLDVVPDAVGGRVAFQVRAGGQDGDQQGQLVSGDRGEPVPARQPAAPGRLSVIDIDTGETQVVAEQPVVAFLWGPQAQQLLYLTAQRDEAGLRTRWHVWDGEESTISFEPFVPGTRLVREYLPFFPQFAQTLTFWSPGGRAFAYPARGEDGTAAIWVQPVERGAEPVRVTDGSVAVWSPSRSR